MQARVEMCKENALFFCFRKYFYLCSPFGAMAERLGTGLQNLVQRFDSASHLKNKRAVKRLFFFAPDSLRHAYAYLL